jgi:Tat protein secretion system quality control protein TatD with DNase activity
MYNLFFSFSFFLEIFNYLFSVSLEASLNAIKNSLVYATIGCHPHFAHNWSSKIESYVYSGLTHPKVVAIGECGIDVSKKYKFNRD